MSSLDLLGHAQQLVDADAVRVAGLRAEVAAGAVGEDVLRLAAPLLVEGELLGRRLVGLATRARRSGARGAGRRRRRPTTRPGTTRCPCRGSGAARRSQSVACSDESTRWPVSADCTAMRAVSTSRISPTRMTSGSWRRIALSPPANVMSACSLIWIWLIDGKTYSTGSSMVMMLRSESLISVSAA